MQFPVLDLYPKLRDCARDRATSASELRGPRDEAQLGEAHLELKLWRAGGGSCQSFLASVFPCLKQQVPWCCQGSFPRSREIRDMESDESAEEKYQIPIY